MLPSALLQGNGGTSLQYPDATLSLCLPCLHLGVSGENESTQYCTLTALLHENSTAVEEPTANVALAAKA